MRPHRALRLVVLGGVIAGALDILYAFALLAPRGVTPVRVLQSVASGLLGQASYQGGMASAMLGLFLHFFITIAAAALFYAAARRLHWLGEHALVSGIVFGVGVYLVMNFVVLPLSAFPHPQTFAPLTVVGGLLVHAFFVGVPIAFCVRAALKPARSDVS
jgi:hypothetical protein